MSFWRPVDVDERELSHVELPSITSASLAETCPEFNKDLYVQSQRIIFNIYGCLKKENPEQLDKFIIKRINELTQLSISTIYRVLKAGAVRDHSVKRKKNKQKFRKVDDAAKDVIRRIVYNLYKENTVPTLEIIRDKLRDYPGYNYQSMETHRDILLNCGFKHKKIDNRMVIMESRRHVEHRQEYLRKIKEYRESNRYIVYLDETWFDTHDVVQYGWVDGTQNCSLNTSCSRGKRTIILHEVKTVSCPMPCFCWPKI